MPYQILTRCFEYEWYGKFCIEKLEINGTCVPLEKSFNAVRVIHNQWRRSLKPNNLAMLVYAYYNLRAIEKFRDCSFV